MSIRIYDAFGGLVKSMSFAGGAEGGRAGTNLVHWDGTNSGGNKVSQGIYYLVIDAGETNTSKDPLMVGVAH